MRRLAFLPLLLAALTGCATPGQVPPATAPTVALRSADLPHGLVVCGRSGDIDAFLKDAPTNNDLATEIEQNWQAIKTLGVKRGIVEVYAQSKTACDNLFTSSTAPGSPTVMCMTVEFKAAATASKAYAQANLASASITSLPGSEQGYSTGLGKTSLSFGDSQGSTSVYIAEWLNGRFLDLLLAVDIGVPASRRAAIDVNSRIH